MSIFERKDISYKPAKIQNDNISETDSQGSLVSKDIVEKESIKVAERIVDHLKVIEEYNKRLETVDYLITNADKLVDELSYSTDRDDIIQAIKAYGGTGNTVTFSMFKQAVDDIIENYVNMTLVSLSGKRP